MEPSSERAKAKGLPEKMIVLEVVLEDDDPPMCPVMSTGVVVGMVGSRLAGGKDKVLTHALPVGCVGGVCSWWVADGALPRGGECAQRRKARLAASSEEKLVALLAR